MGAEESLIYYWPAYSSVGALWGPVLFCSPASVVVCNTGAYERNSPGAARDGGPVVLRPVRATPCVTCYG